MSLSTSSHSSRHFRSSRRSADRRGSGVPLLVLAGVAWGTGGLLGSVLGRETGLTPLAVAAYRLGLGGLLVLVAVVGLTLAGVGDRPAASARWATAVPQLHRIGLLAVLAAAFQACYFTAVSLTTVGLATLVTIGTAPVVVVVVETLRGSARRGSVPVVVLALLGLGLLVGFPATGADPLAAAAGAAAAVFAGSAFAVMTLVGSRTVPGLDPMVATGASFVVGGLLLAVPAAVLGTMAFPVTSAGVGLLALFAVLPTALAYTAYFRGLGAATSPGTGAGAGPAGTADGRDAGGGRARRAARRDRHGRRTPAGGRGAAGRSRGPSLSARPADTIGWRGRRVRRPRRYAQPRCLAAGSAAGALTAPRDVARRISRASAARSAAGVDRRREAIGSGGSGGPKRRFQS